MFKTKWPEGWLPFDDAAPAVEEVCPLKFNYNWAPVRADLIANKGMRFSVLVAHMPTESCLAQDEQIQTECGDMTMLEYFTATTGVDIGEAHQKWESLISGDWYDVISPIQVKTQYGLKDVKRVYYTGLVDILNITLDSGQVVRCTENHRFRIKLEDGSLIWKRAGQLEDGDDILEIIQ